MTTHTRAVHDAVVAALGASLNAHSKLNEKPLLLDLRPPLPPRLRCYVYALVEGGRRRPNEYKAVLRVPGQRGGEYGSFEFEGDRSTVVLAHRGDLDVWVIWEASLHPRFMYAGNIQVHRDTVFAAAATGWAEQRRHLPSVECTEVVIACRSTRLGDALRKRVLDPSGLA